MQGCSTHSQGSPAPHPSRPATPHPLTVLCLRQFNNTLLCCVPKVIQVGARFQVRTRIDVAGMKVRGTRPTVRLRPKGGIEYGEQQDGPCSVLSPRTQTWQILGQRGGGSAWGQSSPMWARTGLAASLGPCPPQPGLCLLSLSTTPVL